MNSVLFLGVVLARKLQKLPKNKCWLVGYSTEDAVEIAREFNKKWETDLRIGLHDCRDYTNSKNLFSDGPYVVYALLWKELLAALHVCIITTLVLYLSWKS